MDKCKVSEDLLINLRVVFASESFLLKIHMDTGHHKFSEDSITFHLNLFQGKDYVPGIVGDGPWSFGNNLEERGKHDTFFQTKTLLHYEGYIG